MNQDKRDGKVEELMVRCLGYVPGARVPQEQLNWLEIKQALQLAYEFGSSEEEESIPPTRKSETLTSRSQDEQNLLDWIETGVCNE